MPLFTITQVKVVEYNAENPSSLTDQAGLNEILFEVSAMRDVAMRYRYAVPPGRTFTQGSAYDIADWGGTGMPNIAIVDWTDLPTADEFLLLRDFFVRSGVPTVICSPEQLEYEKGRLRCGDSQSILFTSVSLSTNYLSAAMIRIRYTRLYSRRCLSREFLSLQAGP